jgi:transposase
MSASKFDATKAAQIVATVSKGNFLSTAANLAGVHVRTVRNWIDRGEKAGRGPLAAFATDVAQAQATFITESLQEIDAGQKDWRALAWILERLRPALFGERVKVRVEAELAAFLEKLKEALEPEAFRTALRVAAGVDAEQSSDGEIWV